MSAWDELTGWDGVTVRSLVEQTRAAGVPCFVKQLGAGPYEYHRARGGEMGSGESTYYPGLRDRKGGDPDEWPADLRVREFPVARP